MKFNTVFFHLRNVRVFFYMRLEHLWFLCFTEQRHSVVNRSLTMQALDHRAECSSILFSVGFSVAHVADFPAPLGAPAYTTSTILIVFKFIMLFFFIFALVEQPNVCGSQAVCFIFNSVYERIW